MINAINILAFFEDAGVAFSIEDEQLKIDAPKNLITQEAAAQIKENKEAIIFILNNYGVTDVEIRKKAGEDWQWLINDNKALRAFANALYKQKIMEQGKTPQSYTAKGYCIHCGKVWLSPEFAKGTALACPWCFNRINGLLIPKVYK